MAHVHTFATSTDWGAAQEAAVEASIGAALTGMVTTASTVVTATDTVVEGIGKLEARAIIASGAATVSTTAASATAKIFCFHQTTGGTPGWIRVSTRVNDTSFTITSSSGTDTSVVAWFIIR
jgi:uncharacterized PurR-regulated membrane protein YhhQ (DUF165 family)